MRRYMVLVLVLTGAATLAAAGDPAWFTRALGGNEGYAFVGRSADGKVAYITGEGAFFCDANDGSTSWSRRALALTILDTRTGKTLLQAGLYEAAAKWGNWLRAPSTNQLAGALRARARAIEDAGTVLDAPRLVADQDVFVDPETRWGFKGKHGRVVATCGAASNVLFTHPEASAYNRDGLSVSDVRRLAPGRFFVAWSAGWGDEFAAGGVSGVLLVAVDGAAARVVTRFE